MSKLKDKLSASMRVVKSNQQSDAAESTARDADQPAAKSAARPAKPSPSVRVQGNSLVDDIPPSGSALFPARVWPD